MKKIKKSVWIAAMSIAAASAGTLMTASSASAQPAGCHQSAYIWYDGPSDEVVGYTPGGCSDSTGRQFTQEVKLDWALVPDPKINSTTQTVSGSSFSLHTYTCGENDDYYSRAYFNASPTYVDSAHESLPTSCS